MDFIQTEEFNKEIECAMHFAADHHVNHSNYKKYQKEIRTFFKDEESYRYYVQNYLKNLEYIQLNEFVDKDINVDCFPVRKSQNDKFFVTDFIEIKYIMHGTITQTLDGRTYVLNENDMCVIAPYVQQSTYLWDDADEVINIAIRSDRFGQVFPRIMKFPNLMKQFYKNFSEEDRAAYLVLRMNQNDGMRAAVTELLEMCSQRSEMMQEIKNGRHADEGDARNLLIETCVERFLLTILQQEVIYRTEASDLPDIKMPFIYGYIRKHISDITIQMIADELGYSRSHTGRYIQAMTGRTYTELLQSIRIHEAAALLQNTEMAVEEIMEAVGYTGKANFYQLFQKYFQMTPAKYRNLSDKK